MNVDKETELLKDYMLYYVDILAHNAMVDLTYKTISSESPVYDTCFIFFSRNYMFRKSAVDFDTWKWVTHGFKKIAPNTWAVTPRHLI